MAVVFLATDTKHNRQVAVKVLRPELSAVVGADRFLREIQVTSQLQHPHILPLYDSGAAAGLLYYVMPVIRGESLRDRLTREQQLPIRDAVAIARAVAGALDYAHREGVVHRDIKPENILLHDGQPVLSDFGIALAVRAAGGERLTQTGFSLGTPSYMSPEQVSGERFIDARADVYALGCVLYEMLAGEPPFTGPNPQAVIAAALTGGAVPLNRRRPTVSQDLAAAVHRALEPVPADRFSTAAEFGNALGAAATVPVRPRPARRRVYAALVCGGVLVGGLLGAGVVTRTIRPAAPASRHLNLLLPEHRPVALAGPSPAQGWQTAIALSPRGDQLAYITPQGRTTMLAVRPLEGDSAVVLRGTEGAYLPFYSPDGQWIAFFSGTLLRKVPAAGGDPVTLVQVDRITGALWAGGDRILVFENEGFDLHWISATGVSADSVVHLGTQFGTPGLLPGGEWAVGQLGSGQLALLSLRDGLELAVTRRGVLALDSVQQSDLLFGTSPHWIEPGYLVYAAGDGDLMALPFDGPRRRVRGEPAPVLNGVRMEAGFGYAEFAMVPEGTLVYVPGLNQLYVTPAFVGPGGHIDTLPFPRGPYVQPRISPDGTLLAAQMRNPVGGWQVLLMDLATGLRRQVPVEGNYRPYPASWMPSGRELMIGLWDPVQFVNYGARIQSLETGQWTDLQLYGASYLSVAPDGKSMIFSDWHTGDLYLRSLGEDTTRRSIPGRGFAASFSPDSRWAAWGSVAGGIQVSPVPATGAIYTAAERGQQPLWSPQGDALIYRDGSRYYRVPVLRDGRFHAGRPELVAEGPFLATFAWNHSMTPDGRLLVLLTGPETQARNVGVITDFPARLRRLTR